MRSFVMNLLATGSMVSMMAREASIDQGFTLADLAEMDTDDVKALDSLLFPIGVYGCRIKKAAIGMNEPKEGINEKTGMPYPPLPFVDFSFEVLEAQPADKSIDAQTLVGRTFNERATLWPDQFKEQIGLLKGKFRKAEIPAEGKMGGMEGGEPGWLDAAVDKMLLVRVRHSKPNAEGIQRAYYDWMPVPDATQEAA